MKRKLLPLLIAGLSVTATATVSAGAPTVYGKVNVTLQSFDLEQINTATGAVVDERDDWQLRSNASRLGVKGDWDITDSLKAIYKLEYEVSIDTGTNSNGRELSARNIVGGFQGGWGTLIAGRHDTPLKLIQEKVDRFNDLQVADISNYMTGEFRRDNIVIYTTPSMGGFAFTAAFAPGESSSDASGTDDGFADTTSFALTYGAGTNLYLAVAHEQNMAANSGAGNSDITRLVGEAVFGPAKIGALYQMAEKHDRLDSVGGIASSIGQFGSPFDEQDAWIISGEFAATKEFILKAQYGQSESSPVAAGLDDAEAKMFALGADYKLDKNSKLFAYYAQLEVDGQTATLSNPGKPKDTTFGIGYELNF